MDDPGDCVGLVLALVAAALLSGCGGSEADVFAAKHTTLGDLKSTIGDRNDVLPEGTNESRIRSVVVINNPEPIAYTAAKLAR